MSSVTSQTSDESDTAYIESDLCRYLDVISHGTFAASGPISNAANLGLVINGLGTVGLPLSKRDAVEISRISHRAPFGKGSETFVDQNVRKTWELNPNQYQLRNPAWLKTVDFALREAAKQLGFIDVGIFRARAHKLLLYEPGAFFNKHREWVLSGKFFILSRLTI